jgi:hypothetical protein
MIHSIHLAQVAKRKGNLGAACSQRLFCLSCPGGIYIYTGQRVPLVGKGVEQGAANAVGRAGDNSVAH